MSKKQQEEIIQKADISILPFLIRAYFLDKSAEALYWLTKYKPFSYYGRQFLFHYDNREYWLFWEKIVKDWYQIWIKGWEKDDYFIYFYCGLDYPKKEGRIEEVQKHIDKRVGDGIAKITSYQNKVLTLRVIKSYFDPKNA